MEEAQLIMVWRQHNITIQQHNMEEAQIIVIWRQHNITIQRHNMEQAQHESMTQYVFHENSSDFFNKYE